MFTAGRAGSFQLVATGSPAPTFSTIAGAGLPAWATLDPNTGIISGTPTDTTGAFPLFIATNAIGTANQSFTLTVLSAPTPLTFSDWATAHGINSAPDVALQSDGLPNLFKYVFDINPTTTMTASDRMALPVVGAAMIEGGETITLTFRENPSETLAINVETSTDLQTWSPAANVTMPQTGTDSATGDPIMQVRVPATRATQFVRLSVTPP